MRAIKIKVNNDAMREQSHFIGSDVPNCHNNNFQPHKDPFVFETTKIAEIRDNFGKLRYKVFMIDMLDYYEEHDRDQRYRITVESFCYGMQPVTILEEFRPTYEIAYDYYKKCIENYKSLVLAETSHFEDINIYAEKIGYHKICPECCATCKFSKPTFDRKPGRPAPFPHDHKGMHDLALVCANEDIFKQCAARHVHDIQPRVSKDGICKHYERVDEKKGF